MNISRLCRAFLVVCAFAVTVACDGTDADTSCNPGTTLACTCANGDSGSQVCNSARTFMPCSCGSSEMDMGPGLDMANQDDLGIPPADGSMGADAACTLDSYEPNEDDSTASALAAVHVINTTIAYMRTEATLHNSADEDWYSTSVTVAAPLSGVTLSALVYEVANPEDYNVSAWFVCDSGVDRSTCDQGAPSTTIGAGCTSVGTPNVSLNADCGLVVRPAGTLYVRVTTPDSATMCGGYAMDIVSLGESAT